MSGDLIPTFWAECLSLLWPLTPATLLSEGTGLTPLYQHREAQCLHLKLKNWNRRLNIFFLYPNIVYKLNTEPTLDITMLKLYSNSDGNSCCSLSIGHGSKCFTYKSVNGSSMRQVAVSQQWENRGTEVVSKLFWFTN